MEYTNILIKDTEDAIQRLELRLLNEDMDEELREGVYETYLLMKLDLQRLKQNIELN
jgi:hypothetical protein